MDSFWFSETALSWYSSIGVVAFFSLFVGVIVWAATRTRRQVDHWASLPLELDSTADGHPVPPSTRARKDVTAT